MLHLFLISNTSQREELLRALLLEMTSYAQMLLQRLRDEESPCRAQRTTAGVGRISEVTLSSPGPMAEWAKLILAGMCSPF